MKGDFSLVSEARVLNLNAESPYRIHKSDPLHRIGGFQIFGDARVLHKGGENFFDAPVCGGLDFQKMWEQGFR